MIHANTPSYVGSHVTGFSNMVKAMVDYFAKPVIAKQTTINLIPGWIEPADIREIKRLTAAMGLATITLPDTSDVLDTPQTGKHEFYPKGGVTVEQLRATGASRATVALGPMASGPAAKQLDATCKVPCEILALPLRSRSAALEATSQPDPAAKDGPADGVLWIRQGDLVGPIKVRVGLSDGVIIEISGGVLTEGAEIVVGANRLDSDPDALSILPHTWSEPQKK